MKFLDFIEIAKQLQEEAPTNVTGANVATDQPIVRRGKFANKEVFEVTGDCYSKCTFGKAKYHKYENYVGNDATGEAIRQFGRENPKASILVRNKDTGSMMYLRKND
jgi:hypothetical protein